VADAHGPVAPVVLECRKLGGRELCRLGLRSTLAQKELPLDLNVLRAQQHGGCLGVYGSVPSGGTVRVGDPITLHR
jgi:hypothetical protein